MTFDSFECQHLMILLSAVCRVYGTGFGGAANPFHGRACQCGIVLYSVALIKLASRSLRHTDRQNESGMRPWPSVKEKGPTTFFVNNYRRCFGEKLAYIKRESTLNGIIHVTECANFRLWMKLIIIPGILLISIHGHGGRHKMKS